LEEENFDEEIQQDDIALKMNLPYIGVEGEDQHPPHCWKQTIGQMALSKRNSGIPYEVAMH
jgi:hypothetical protein